MKRPLYITGGGAVTPGGLNRRQTLAAIRAGLSAYEEFLLSEPMGASQTVSRIPTHWSLRATDWDWLVNMAARAIMDALASPAADPRTTLLMLVLPEKFRNHPAFEEIDPSGFLNAVMQACGGPFHEASRAIDGGAAASIGVLDQLSETLARPDVERILLGGVDSLVNDKDIARLGAAGRLKGSDNAQGVVPGEAAAFVCLQSRPDPKSPGVASIHGAGFAQEADSVLTERYSQGKALLGALQGTLNGAGNGPREPDIVFVVSNGNGERYSGWEANIARSRFYRTRREILPIAYPAMTVGDVGAASGALALLVAADSFTAGYAPGPVAMCEIASEAGLRAAALVSRVNFG
ncbi:MULTISPECIES: hypothetical protein [Mesorhizobium]|uniref:3-oxoacyl-[acyl-carrier-protein] synthase-1 n=1 Tax=Mesorhizobium shonense TaxID=1209948 RepID=A0ABV2HM32_9HYPH|nr:MULTISPECIES: hypothetical protein [unclassified Mesorhizobium]AZO31825.1 hypothetical protein EJ071_33490 [Mesorhizobium sp. M1B.F.Ca.ET.045.04.1.1]RWB20967.1 MAG: hypothetical protein EOQ40_12240 [Mesorhizobium sp.]RWD99874.1 MAG: hypothetical protein EOS40_17920 [Mesorhizobium sp.]TIS46889.1 MAG: hypothetical protein E5W96_25105 [Mesorhizobium sp.]